MQNRCWFYLKISLVILALGGALLFQRAGAATLCTDLPPSTLRVYDIKASAVEEVWVSAEELDHRGKAEDLVSRHRLMLSVSDIVTWFDIVHRMVLREGGSICDAPSLVRMGFGSSRRLVFFARAAAEDACVRRQMLDHEAAHARALNEAVDRFIDQHESNFQRGMMALKQTPAPSAEIARVRWESGMRLILSEAKQQLLVEVRSANDEIDASSAVANLESACDGRTR